MRKHLLLAFGLLSALMTQAADLLQVNNASGAFALFAGGRAAVVSVSPSEPIAVQKVASLFADDVQRVTGVRPQLTTSGKVPASPAVVIATLGHHAYVDGLVAKGRLDVSAIRGGWERFLIRVVDGRLLIVGSDRRGAAYGAFTVSEQMGVSPWYWWADVPVRRQSAVYVSADYVSKSPSVKYRGIFINDEDWGLKPWATHNYERQLGDIGPRTYARVCELLLRLKANMLAPAMHTCTGAFYSHPESKQVCDSFGIVITTSHCEPLLLNNAAPSEWNLQRDGEWNYKTNRETILRKWDNRLSEASQYENLYTVAMRGLHDEGLRGNLPMAERVPLLAEVIAEQRRLLTKHTGRAATDIPQIFVPYKETMDIYEHGLSVPDDITLVWVDDNYGYLKRVSSPAEQQRSGRSGVYYHLSYLGAPHDYLWLNTTPPVLMYEELKKAYDTGADRYWLLNVGDIKPMELGVQTFMDMAWDFDAFSLERAHGYQARLLTRLFPQSADADGGCSRYQQLLDTYYRLAWSRKPEYMGWEYEWDDPRHTGLHPTEFSFVNYDEAQQRLADYRRLSDAAEQLSDGSEAWFELVQYPFQGAYQMNRKFLLAQLNQELLHDGPTARRLQLEDDRLAVANWAARQSTAAYDSINALNHRYNNMLNGKWDSLMAVPAGFCALYQQMPVVTHSVGAGERSVSLQPTATTATSGCYVVALEGYEQTGGGARLIDGLGYDWRVMQLGTVTYRVPAVAADTIDVVFYTLPFWPLYAGRSNAVEVSVDGGAAQSFSNVFREYDRSWKDQVMRNGKGFRARFAVDRSQPYHLITFRAPGDVQLLQRVMIDWGGLQPSYVGPAAAR